MTPFGTLRARAIVLPVDDVDTDQIIPARYLKGTSKVGLGDHLFADWRNRPDFPLSREGARGAQILVAGDNFGCGSSREHAPWALVDWGFRAIVAPSFADIFRENATKNGLLPVALGRDAVDRLARVIGAQPDTEIAVDLARGELAVPGVLAFAFTIEPFARRCLLEGLDELGTILACESSIDAYERRNAP